ncbi:MAG: LptF/LptG family permease [Treponema sp.]|nr:LptF/LptG family permease [Treponema sp.]
MILDKYLLRQFFPIFLVALSLFSFVLLLIDLFANLTRYLNNEVPVLRILQMGFFYIPQCLSFALPISLLFAAAYTLGDLHARNELACVFCAGIPFRRFSISLLLVGFLVSVFSFFFDDIFVIPAVKIKNDLSRRALNQFVTESDSDIVIKTRNGRLTYSVDYFDNNRKILNGVSIIEINENGEFVSQIRAHSAQWNENYWEFNNALVYKYEDGLLLVSPFVSDSSYNEHPDIFRRQSVNIDELPVSEARLLIDDLRSVGLPYFEEQADYYHRYSFASTSFIVMILSVSMGGRFRKNIMLMSLFTSLAAAVVYYVVEMLTMAMAGLNYIPAVLGAWFPVFLFIFIGFILLWSAKT